ncbi:apoptosis regulator R11 [Parasteatoda tepidariorum]|uniref:apoptosis regulator R11 n=1 Tax=Parasteatoda tepidariorum TaxID=114398 RepID=UPI00077F8EEA|nr:apoptosis regulator R11 [Parasteatoda tepidariorum]
MPPNSFNRPPAVRAISESEIFSKRSAIRTDYILQNLYKHLIKDVCCFEAICPANKNEEELFTELKKILDDFKFRNGSKIDILCSQLVISMDTLGSALYGVSNELFVEGYTWSRIIAFFVFVSILTVQCVENNLSENVVDVMYENFCRLVKENLKPWIDDHGGWEGFLSLKDDRPVGWANNIWRNTYAAVTNLVHLANFPA